MLLLQLLKRLTDLCEQRDKDGKNVKHQKHEQRLLKNLGAHQAVLDLLQVPHDEVRTLHSATYFLLEYL